MDTWNTRYGSFHINRKVDGDTGGLSTPVLHGFDHGDDIFDGGSCLDVVAGARDIAAVFSEGFEA